MSELRLPGVKLVARHAREKEAGGRAGAVRTLYQLLDDRRLNHRVEVVPGLLAAEGATLLRDFFGRLRR